MGLFCIYTADAKNRFCAVKLVTVSNLLEQIPLSIVISCFSPKIIGGKYEKQQSNDASRSYQGPNAYTLSSFLAGSVCRIPEQPGSLFSYRRVNGKIRLQWHSAASHGEIHSIYHWLIKLFHRIIES